MDLATEVQARIPSVRLVQLTNGQVSGASTVNATVLATAVTDAETDFQLYAEESYDGTDQRHVTIGVRGVLAYLKTYIGQDSEDDLVKAFQAALKVLKGTSARGRIEPMTTSFITPSDDPVDGDGVTRPDADRARFQDLAPRPPGSGEVDDGFWNPA